MECDAGWEVLVMVWSLVKVLDGRDGDVEGDNRGDSREGGYAAGWRRCGGYGGLCGWGASSVKAID